jgi:hypothetical protein
MKQTALYFNSELDTIHIVDDDLSTKCWTLAYRASMETVKSIKALAIGHQCFDGLVAKYIAERLVAFERLETLILVVDGETDEEGASIRENMEDDLVTTKDRFILRGQCNVWNLPAVKVMTPGAFENHL